MVRRLANCVGQEAQSVTLVKQVRMPGKASGDLNVRTNFEWDAGGQMKRRLALICAMMLLAGCAGASPQSGSTSSPESKPDSVEAPSELRILSKAELKKALLPVKALPTGYGVDPDADGKDSGKTYCNYKPPVDPTTYVEGSFIKGGGISAEILLIIFRQFDSADDASRAFDALVETMETCTKDTLDGEPVKFSVLSMPELEEGSIAINLIADNFSAPQFFTLVGPTMIVVGGGGFMGNDPDMLVDLLKKQINKYKEAAAA